MSSEFVSGSVFILRLAMEAVEDARRHDDASRPDPEPRKASARRWLRGVGVGRDAFGG